MNTTLLKSLLITYENKRNKKLEEAERKKEKLYNDYPKFTEIDDKLSTLSIQASKNLINSNNFEYLDTLRKQIELLKKEKHELLVSVTNDENYLQPVFDCKLCNDTGYITNNYNTQMCNCLKQQLFDLEYNKTNISNLENHKFENFLSTCYSENVDIEKYNSDISPRENIEIIKKIAFNFINNFDKPEEKNLLFTGNTGLGKTYISECMNNMKFTELFNVINTRLLNQNNKITKTIISTNLNIQDLFKNYDERIVSRLIGNYNICRFFGDDIRLMKKFK